MSQLFYIPKSHFVDEIIPGKDIERMTGALTQKDACGRELCQSTYTPLAP